MNRKNFLCQLAVMLIFVAIPTIGVSQKADPQGTYASDLLRYGMLLENQAKIDEAIIAYKKIIKEYPAAGYEDEVGAGTYSQDARERLNVMYCLKDRKEDFSGKSRDEVIAFIGNAIKKNDGKMLSKYASCDFKVGKPESDAVWQLDPAQAGPVIVSLRKKSTSAISFQNYEDFPMADPKYDYEHTFLLKEHSGRWKWVGFYTTDEIILERLWKIKQKSEKATR